LTQRTVLVPSGMVPRYSRPPSSETPAAEFCRLLAELSAHGLNKQDVAQRVGVAPVMVSRYQAQASAERGEPAAETRASPSPRVLAAMRRLHAKATAEPTA
jgi:transposase-like protein